MEAAAQQLAQQVQGTLLPLLPLADHLMDRKGQAPPPTELLNGFVDAFVPVSQV